MPALAILLPLGALFLSEGHLVLFPRAGQLKAVRPILDGSKQTKKAAKE
jgi:hypothetical protein